MAHSTPNNGRIKDFLYALSDERLNGRVDLARLALRYDVPVAEARQFAAAMDRLDEVFVDVEPPAHFKRRLHNELMGKPQRGIFGRVRNLPPRLQIAAAVALLAAMALLGRRRLLGEAANLLQQARRSQSDSAPQGQEAKVSLR